MATIMLKIEDSEKKMVARRDVCEHSGAWVVDSFLFIFSVHVETRYVIDHYQDINNLNQAVSNTEIMTFHQK